MYSKSFGRKLEDFGHSSATIFTTSRSYNCIKPSKQLSNKDIENEMNKLYNV
jgi:hypothetical protein